MIPISFTKQKAHCSEGFTLLELLLVIMILSAVAWMSMSYVDNNSNQVRFEDTRNRLEIIKRAIIGDISRTINGQPEIRGYVADLGNLPPSIQALIEKDYCQGYPEMTAPVACTTAGGAWIEQGEYCTDHISADDATCVAAGKTWIDEYIFDSDYNLWTGWNGPYLNAKELANYSKFRDGWGNVATAATPAMNNFGWVVTVADDFTIKSVGVDSIEDASGGGTSTYELDYPYTTGITPLVEENQYTVTITNEGTVSAGDGLGSITVDFGTPEPCWGCWDGTASAYITTSPADRAACEAVSTQNWRPILGVNDPTACTTTPYNPPTSYNGVWLQTATPTDEICIKAAYRDNGELLTYASVDSSINTKAESTFTWDGSRQQLNFVFPDDTKLPMGVLSYNIYEYNSTLTPPCTAAEFQKENTSWSILTVVPGISTTPLIWKLQ